MICVHNVYNMLAYVCVQGVSQTALSLFRLNFLCRWKRLKYSLNCVNLNRFPFEKWMRYDFDSVGFTAKHPLLVSRFFSMSHLLCASTKKCVFKNWWRCFWTALYIRGMRCVRMHGMYCHFCCTKSVRSFHFVCTKYIRDMILWETTPKWNCLYALKIA